MICTNRFIDMKIKRKVFKLGYNQQKLVTIPKYCEIEAGDCVLIEQCTDNDNKIDKKKNRGVEKPFRP